MIGVAFIRFMLCLSVLSAGGLAHGADTILVFGDSLSAAYGIRQEAGWVRLLEQRLARVRLDLRVVNASVSGETTAGGAARFTAALAKHEPRVVILALGANDGLRGLPAAAMRDNLSAMVSEARKRGVRVLVAGMKLPPNYGQRYGREFEAAFTAVANRHKTAFVPFLLEGVAGKRELFLDDWLHPTEAAQPIILENVWRGLQPLLK
jgi:acyl-CoA thioesterase I